MIKRTCRKNVKKKKSHKLRHNSERKKERNWRSKNNVHLVQIKIQIV